MLDAQYVALAQSLNAPLITEDRKLGAAVPGIVFHEGIFGALTYGNADLS